MRVERQPAGTALALRDPWPWGTFAGLVRRAEDLGYAGVFLPEIAGRDSIAALAALAGTTRTILLGTGVVPITSRRAFTTAMGAATVHERSGGRMILGLGTGPAEKGALAELERQVAQIRALLGHGGEDGRGLTLALGSPVPVWIAALGPRAVALAGTVADGVLLNWCTAERVAEARAAIRRSAEEAHRDPDQVTVAVYVRAAVTGDLSEDPKAAAGALDRAAAEYASYRAYAQQFARMGLAAEVEAALAGAPRALAQAVGLTGDPARARDRLRGFRDAGADLAVVYPVAFGAEGAASVRTTLQSLAPTV